MKNNLKTFGAALLCVTLVGCADGQFKSIGAGILSSTGYVNGSQAEGIFSAGEKLGKSQQELSAEQEYYLGRAASARILGKFQPKLNPALNQYVNKIGDSLAAVSDSPETFGGYHFAVIESDQINAMSAPGGFIFVSSAFVKLMPDEDAMAAVLAHEVGHVVKKHGVNAISNANLFSALGGLTQTGLSVAASNVGSPVDLTQITDLFGESVNGVMDKLLTSGYSHKQEYEADAYAAELLQRAGYDPAALIRTLKILDEHKKGQDGGWFETHPSPEDRIDEVQGDIKPSDAKPNSVRVARFTQAMKSL